MYSSVLVLIIAFNLLPFLSESCKNHSTAIFLTSIWAPRQHLITLHKLPVQHRTQIKVLVWTHKVLYGNVSACFTSMCHHHRVATVD